MWEEDEDEGCEGCRDGGRPLSLLDEWSAL